MTVHLTKRANGQTDTMPKQLHIPPTWGIMMISSRVGLNGGDIHAKLALSRGCPNQWVNES